MITFSKEHGIMWNGEKLKSYVDANEAYTYYRMMSNSEKTKFKNVCADWTRNMFDLLQTSPLLRKKATIAKHLHTLKSPLTYNASTLESWDIDYYPKVVVNGVEKQLQRPYVWSDFQREDFIKELFQVRDVVGIVMVECEFGKARKYQVIDGKHRLISYFKFKNNEFTIDGKFYKDLLPYEQFYFDTMKFQIAMLYDSEVDEFKLSDVERVDIYDHLNFKATPHHTTTNTLWVCAHNIQQIQPTYNKVGCICF